MLGTAELYNVTIGDKVPPVNYYAALSTHKKAKNFTNTKLVVDYDHEQCWDAIQPAISLLDEACPEAAVWARERYDLKLLRWVDNDFIYASYQPATGRLSISRGFFALSDGERAVTIAHEFRHSRQNFSKLIIATIGLILTGDDAMKDGIIEPDAYWFEQNVRIALFGAPV
jgi:hypothetical protein